MDVLIDSREKTNVPRPVNVDLGSTTSLFDAFVALGEDGREAAFNSFTRRIVVAQNSPWHDQSLCYLRGAIRAALACGASSMEELLEGLSFDAFCRNVRNMALDAETRSLLGEYTQTLIGFDKDGSFSMLAKTFHGYVATPLCEFFQHLIHGGDELAAQISCGEIDWKKLGGSLYRARASNRKLA